MEKVRALLFLSNQMRSHAGLSQGLGGFGLSLLGAVAGIVDQPIQGIRRASDVREAASGIITGVGKGLLGVVTKPLGGAMELVSQTGQGILQGAGLTQLPSRVFTPGERLQFFAKNSHLKYFWYCSQFLRSSLYLNHMMSVVVCSRLKGSRANANDDLDVLKHLK